MIRSRDQIEWRTPVLPLMSRFSLAYHSPAGEVLDPMNLKPQRISNGGTDDSERGYILPVTI